MPPTLRIHAAFKRTMANRQKRLHAQYLRSRNVSVLLLSELRCAGVFAGLDSENMNHPNDPPANERGGFFSYCRQFSIVGEWN
jgi:hypothetical protein